MEHWRPPRKCPGSGATCNVPLLAHHERSEPQNQATHTHTHTHTHCPTHCCTAPHAPTHSLTTCSIAFKDGDTLSFKDTGANGVLQILSTAYTCGGNVPDLLSQLMSLWQNPGLLLLTRSRFKCCVYAHLVFYVCLYARARVYVCTFSVSVGLSLFHTNTHTHTHRHTHVHVHVCTQRWTGARQTTAAATACASARKARITK